MMFNNGVCASTGLGYFCIVIGMLYLAKFLRHKKFLVYMHLNPHL